MARAWSACGDGARSLDAAAVHEAVKPVTPYTRADSIAVGVPRNRLKAWARVAGTGGGFLAVTDAEIAEAAALMARLAGVWAEPSGAAGMAGAVKALGEGAIAPSARVVVMVTGHGLKDPQAATC